MIVEYNNIKYKVEKNQKDGFDETAFLERVTEYFEPYDYIFGDWAYSKLRLKGFYDSKNKEAKPLNDIKNLDKYIKDNCAYDCKYFLLKKVNKE